VYSCIVYYRELTKSLAAESEEWKTLIAKHSTGHDPQVLTKFFILISIIILLALLLLPKISTPDSYEFIVYPF
jgi:hypothetical protein